MIPQRSNKDCRKRYYNEVAGGLKKVQEMEQSSCSRIDLTHHVGSLDEGRRRSLDELCITVWPELVRNIAEDEKSKR